MNERRFIVAVDLGFASDPTAIAVLERSDITTGEKRKTWKDGRFRFEEQRANTFLLRHLERPPLRTRYPDIVTRLRAIMGHRDLGGAAELVVDATGVGRPVVQLMEQDGLQPIPVLITGGHKETCTEDGTWNVPKRSVVMSLSVLFHERRLRVAETMPLVKDLMAELDAFRVKVNARTRNESYEAWREGDHDDLVFAVGLGAWWGEMERPKRWKPGKVELAPADKARLEADTHERLIEDMLEAEGRTIEAWKSDMRNFEMWKQ